jgi:hypothetical protein
MNTSLQILQLQLAVQQYRDEVYRQNQYRQSAPRTEVSSAPVPLCQNQKLVPREEKLQFLGRREMSLEKSLDAEDDTPLPPFLKLPSEIIQIIASYLSPSSVAALALSCHNCMFALGTECLEQCSAKKNASENRALLEFLSTDWEQYILCCDCIKLHKLDYRRLFQAKCIKSPRNYGGWLILSDGFEFIHLQMAMKLYRSGKNASPAIEYLTKTDDKVLEMHQSFLWRLPCITHEARIDRNEFLFRSQFCFLIPLAGTCEEGIVKQLLNNSNIAFRPICRHLRIGDIDGLPRIISCLRGHILYSRNPADCRRCNNVWECQSCGAEFSIALKDYGARLALVITRWLNLGPGISPDDEKWKRIVEWGRQGRISHSTGIVSRRWEGGLVPEFTSGLSEAQEKVLFDLRWKDLS